MKGIKKNQLAVMKSHKDVKHSIGKTVNNIVISLYGVGWVLDLLGTNTL